MDMSVFENVFKVRKVDIPEFDFSYKELLSRALESISVQPMNDELHGSKRRIRECSLLLRQIFLHRVIKLYSGALQALVDDNIYSMALSIRGHFETTAALGYLHNRLNSLSKGYIDSVAVDDDITAQLFGTKDAELRALQEQGTEPKQILTMLEYADRSVAKHILNASQKESSLLSDSYKFLCEFSHPNYHSNACAFELIKEENKFHFMHNRPVKDYEFGLIKYLLISNPLFIELFDQIETLLPV